MAGGADLSVPAMQDEALDALLWRVLGSTDALEAVLEANPSLAALPPLLPEGRVVIIPAAALAMAQDGAVPRAAPVVNLWD